MNTVAYVVAWFRIVDGKPVFQGAGTFSESAKSLSYMVDKERTMMMLDVLEAHGDDYEDAIKKALKECAAWPQYAWVVPHVEEERARRHW